MTEAPRDGTVRAVSTLLMDRAHLLLPLASHLRQEQPEFESTIRGSSMWPAIPPGARLRVRVGPQESCRIGDVVLFLTDDGYTVHRVVSRARHISGEAYLLTEGDARLAPDPPLPSARVLGTVIAVEHAGRWRSTGPPSAHRWYRRATRAATRAAMMAVMSLNVSAATRLAALFLALESTARGGVRAAKREARLAAIRLSFVLDRIRHPGVKYRKPDARRVNALFPATRREEVARTIRDSLAEADNEYFRNPTAYNSRHLFMPRGIPALDDLYPPNVAVLDFLAHRIARPEQEVLLDFPCGIGALLVYARDLGLMRIHGYDNWNYLGRSTAERFLQRFGIPPSVLLTESDLPGLPLTILTCVGYPLTLLAKNSSVWAKPSVRYVLADRMDRPLTLPGFRRAIEYGGLLTVFERVA
ncbi:MAG TPA: S24/S26 family peptidase [Candidatus Methylomirabilis sp.]|nr:S24/S26 family peptidase [Candidatus Methylomirabilis sp.]